MTAEELAQAAFAAFNRGDLGEAERLFLALSTLVPDWVPCAYGLGMTYFQRGAYADAMPLLRRACEAGIGLPDSWTYLCHALAMLEQDDVLAAILSVSVDAGAKADLVFQIFNNRVARGREETVLPLRARLPLEPAVRMSADFWAGIVRAGSDLAAARGSFAAALGHAADLRKAGIDSPLVASHIAAGAGIEAEAFVLAPAPDPTPGQIVWHDPARLADPSLGLIFAAADGAYTEAFASECAASLAQLGPGRTLHLHIVDPGPDVAAQAAAIRAAAPGLTVNVSTETAAGDAVYYACARFLLLPALLQRYRATISVIDIDCLFQPAASRLPDLGPEADVALFRLETVFPWLQYPAAMVILRDTAGAAAFADLTASFLRRKLAGGRSWTLDQAALFCVVETIRRKRPEIVVAELTAATGLVLDDLVRSQGSFAAKRALRLKTV
jgi:hypothetical protein